MTTIRYTPDHEWVATDGHLATVGITSHARDALGEVVYVDLPPVGQRYDAKDAVAVVESVKAAADVYMPIAGEVVEVNDALRDDPSAVNQDPLGAGWFFKFQPQTPSDLDDLLDETRYSQLTAEDHP